MRALLRRVSRASVTVEGQTISTIGKGLLVLLAVGHRDGEEQAKYLAEKIANLRVFEDEQGKTNLSVQDVGGGVLVVSQFTLYADTRKGRRPSFIDAAPPEIAAPLVDYYAERLRAEGIQRIEQGVFGAMMLIEIHNDGTVTIILDSTDLK